jgi:hypothetical protein
LLRTFFPAIPWLVDGLRIRRRDQRRGSLGRRSGASIHMIRVPRNLPSGNSSVAQSEAQGKSAPPGGQSAPAGARGRLELMLMPLPLRMQQPPKQAGIQQARRLPARGEHSWLLQRRARPKKSRISRLGRSTCRAGVPLGVSAANTHGKGSESMVCNPIRFQPGEPLKQALSSDSSCSTEALVSDCFPQP